MKMAPIPAWLDDATAALVEETVRMLIKRHGNILLAVILFGSVARHEERPLDDSYPSDVDLLAIFDTTDRLVKPYREDIHLCHLLAVNNFSTPHCLTEESVLPTGCATS